jgi:predicted Zn-dependent peptidase
MKFSRLTSIVALLGSVSLFAVAAPVRAATASAPLPSVEISYTKVVLKNGLTLIVHEDHKAPVVAVNIWYHVGSKNEPPGRTGFAHLFEHLMFGGKNGNQKGWFERMEAVGATDLNGTTYYDRTNFFETVPTPALDMTLYLEARRMGHLLDSFDEKTLTTQRGVVQNEKRQDENEPYAVSDELITKSIWPASHPYSHTVIGEMTDLDAAKVDDVKDWFSKYYGPTNATIAISGDITPAQAKAKVEQYFGAIPPGPPVARQTEWVAKRSGEQRATAQDHVPQARLYKVWNTPGYGTPDSDYLDLLSDVLTTGKDSRLYKRLVYQDQIATTVQSYEDNREVGGVFQVELTAKPGVPLDRLEAGFNEELARLLRDGPTQAEVDRYKTRRVAAFVRGVERVGGFGGTSDILAESQTYMGSPDGWKVRLDRVRAATPADLLAAGRRWLSDGDFTLDLTPFPQFAAAQEPTVADVPAAGAIKPPSFVRFKRATLSNGLKVIVAERHDTPTLTLRMVMDAGEASDQFAKPGTAKLTAATLADGTRTLDALALSDRIMSLGATLSASTGNDTTSVTMGVLTPQLDPSLDLYADVIRRPAFRAEDVAREKAQQIAAIQQAKQEPIGEVLRIEPELIYGPTHAYGVLATEGTVAALTPADLSNYHATWFQPAGATLVVVGDTTLEQILPKLQARFGDWAPVKTPAKNIGPVQAPPAQTVYLIDKPGALQSVIAAAIVAPPRVNPDDLAIQAMNTSLGGAFTSRLNMNLREDKHWAYGAFSFVEDARGPGLFTSLAPVQTDKTAESFAEVRRELSDIVATRPLTPDELALAQGDLTRSLPGRWETNEAVASTLSEMVAYGLPDSYYDAYAGRIGALTTVDLARAAHTVVRPDAMTWVIMGDRSKIEPSLIAQGLQIRRIDADGRPVS